ncbi:MAG: hypothetical protein ACXABY_26590 [Candidatus Thorarchaeota archaeon]
MIFIIGVYVGSLVDSSSLEDISGDLSRVSQRVASVQLLFLMEGNSSSFCPVYTSELTSIDKEMELMGHKLSYLEEQKGVTDVSLKKNYFTVEAESYLLSKKVGELCEDNDTLLMYFYSNKGCSDCKQQGADILKARDELLSENITMKIYSFDGDLGSPVADAFKHRYVITTYPSLVINGKTYFGYKDSTELKKLIRSDS